MVRSKSVYSQRNLGTIKQRKREKRQDKGKDYRGTAEMMMRILRMRCVAHLSFDSGELTNEGTDLERKIS